MGSASGRDGDASSDTALVGRRWDDVFRMVSRTKVYGGKHVDPADRILWRGEMNGRTVFVQTTVRHSNAGDAFFVSSNARLRYDVEYVHYVELVSLGLLSESEKDLIARMAQAVDSRPVVWA